MDEPEEVTPLPVSEADQVDLKELTLEQAIANWENAVGGFQGSRIQWKVLEGSIAMVKKAALSRPPSNMNRAQRRAKK